MVRRLPTVSEVNELWVLVLNLCCLLCINLSVNVQSGQQYVDSD